MIHQIINAKMTTKIDNILANDEPVQAVHVDVEEFHVYVPAVFVEHVELVNVETSVASLQVDVELLYVQTV